MKKMVEKFQCPGCVCGCDTECGSFNYDDSELRCVSHVLGTSIGAPGNSIALGLPKGFNKPGYSDNGKRMKNKMDIRLFPKGQHPTWDKLNVPVWAMEDEGFLFVRTFAPRINLSWVDVIDGAKIGLVPEAIDVSKFFDEID